MSATLKEFRTNSIQPLETENILDPRLEAMKYGQDNMKWTIFKGCQNQNWTKQQANSYSTAGINWNFNTQSENSLIDRRLYARVQFKIIFTGTSPIGQPLLLDEHDAPRCFPLASITNSLKASVNGTSFECQYSNVIEGMLRYNNSHELRTYDLSMTPDALDNYQRYADGVGSTRNPLSNYNNGSYAQGRGAFRLDSLINPVSVDGVTPTQSEVVFTVTEPLLLSPFLYSSQDLQSGFYGVKNLAVQYSFNAGKLDRIWSHNALNPGVTISTMNVTLPSPPSLLVNYLNPPLLDSIGQVPRAPVYQYYKTDVNVNDFNTTLNPGATATFTNNAIQISTIPQSIYIWFNQPLGSKDYTSTDTFFTISGLTLSYLGVSGQFGTMDANDLYVMCVKNGLKSSWTEFAGRTQSYGTSATSLDNFGLTGSVVKISIEDLAMPDNLASGVNINSQLQFSCTITNTNTVETLPVQSVCMLVYDGIATVVDGNCITQVGIITQQDVVETRAEKGWVDYTKAQRMYGGGLFSKLGSLAKNLLTPENVMKVAQTVIPAAREAFSGKGMTGGALTGGALMGGARMTADEMRRRLLE